MLSAEGRSVIRTPPKAVFMVSDVLLEAEGLTRRFGARLAVDEIGRAHV